MVFALVDSKEVKVVTTQRQITLLWDVQMRPSFWMQGKKTRGTATNGG